MINLSGVGRTSFVLLSRSHEEALFGKARLMIKSPLTVDTQIKRQILQRFLQETVKVAAKQRVEE